MSPTHPTDLPSPTLRERQEGWAALIEQLATTSASALSDAALDAAGRLIADSLICAAAGARFERSRALQQVLEREGGRPECWTAGNGVRLPASRAAMLNAETVNLLDADDTFFNMAHFGGLIVAVALAQAERFDSTWSELRRAVVLGFELDAKLTLACRANDGFIAPGLMLPGAVVTAAVLAGATAEHMGAALGLGLRLAPSAVTRQVCLAEPSSFKYAPYGSMGEQAVLAADLATAGYRSSPELMVCVPGFLQGQQVGTVRWEQLRSTDSSRGWWIEQTSLKPYPSFRLGHPAIDAMRQIVEQHSLRPEAIEAVDIHMDPRALRLPFHHWTFPNAADPHWLPIVAAMNLRLSATLAALKVPPGPRWLEPATLQAPQTRSFYDRVRLCDTPAIDSATFELKKPARGEAFARVVIHTKAGRREAYKESADGDPWSSATRPDWSWLLTKEQNFLQSSSLTTALRALTGQAPIAGILACLGSITTVGRGG